MLRARCLDEARPPSLFGVAVERELRHDENRTGDVREREIHLLLGVAEDAQPHDFVGHPRQLFFGVAMREAREQYQPLVDVADDAPIHTDFRA